MLCFSLNSATDYSVNDVMLKEALNKRVMNFSTRERQQDYFLFTQKLNNLKRLALGRGTPYLKNSELTRGSLIPQNHSHSPKRQK